MKSSFESLFSRSISIASKFITLTFLTKVLSLSDYGSYQLIVYFTMISVYIYGMEYYMYGNREVAKNKNDPHKLNNHVSFFFTLLPVSFTLQLLALFYLIPNKVLNIYVVIFILFINFSEYFNQEVYRYLIMMQKIRKANFLLVCKSIIFLFLLLCFFYIYNILFLSTLIYLMTVSYMVLFTISLYFFNYDIVAIRNLKIKFLNKSELKNTFNFLSPFIGLMISTKGLEFFDKFAIEYFYGSKEVGIYSFLYSISSLIYVFITSGFYLVYLPILIEMYENKNIGLKNKISKYSKLILIFSTLIVVGIIFTIEPLLKIIDKTELIENIGILYILLGSFLFLSISTIPTILLYIAKRDKELMKIMMITFMLNIGLNILLLKSYNIYGAAIALVVSYFINLIISFYNADKVWKKIKKDFL